MALRKFIYQHAKGYHAEQNAETSLEIKKLEIATQLDMNSNTINNLPAATAAGELVIYGQENAEFDGITIYGGLNIYDNKVINLASGTDDADAVNLGQLDAAVAGLTWKLPIHTANTVGVADSAPSATAGDAYLVGTTWGGFTTGDLVEYDGASWNLILATAGSGKPGAAIRALVSATPTPTGDFSGKAGQIASRNGANDAWVFENPANGSAVPVMGDGSVYENLGFARDEDGIWVVCGGTGRYLAGLGLSLTGTTFAVRTGDGTEITDPGADYLSLKLAANSGLKFEGSSPDGELSVKVHATNPGLEIDGGNGLRLLVNGEEGVVGGSSGIEVELESSPATLAVDGDGLKVVGVPLEFEIGGFATGDTVSKTNMDSLVGGTAITIHSHPGMDEAKQIKNSLANVENIAAKKPVYFSSTANKVGLARADTDAKAYVIGIAPTGGNQPGPIDVVSGGLCEGVLTGLSPTAGDKIYLAATGGLQIGAPASGRIIACGVAKNADDLLVNIQDLGKIPA